MKLRECRKFAETETETKKEDKMESNRVEVTEHEGKREMHSILLSSVIPAES